MEKKFMLTLHVSESELTSIASFFYGRWLYFEKIRDATNSLRCSTMQYQIECNMTKEQKEGEEYEAYKEFNKKMASMAK
jgi:hypothetical protein